MLGYEFVKWGAVAGSWARDLMSGRANDDGAR